MTFKDANAVLDTLKAGDELERVRGANRKIVNEMFGGAKPLSDDEATRMGMAINVQWGEAPVLFCQAVRNYTNAFQRPARYFKVSIPDAPIDQQAAWEQWITRFINRKMKNSIEYFYKVQHENSSVVSHGIGPGIWEDKDDWAPRFLAIADLRVPTDTEVSFRNVEWIAYRCNYTEGELSAKAFSDGSSKKWNRSALQKILDEYHDKTQETDCSWNDAPEKMASRIKQNGGRYESDAVPTIPLWHFYFKDRNEKTGKVSWLLRIVSDKTGGCKGAPENAFLYDSGNESYADALSEILAVQFGDLNTDAPFLYHSVRSLGFLLVEPCFYTNLARCRLLQFMLESFNTFFRVTDPAGKARAMEIQLFDKAIIPEGVAIVPREQRNQIDAGVAEMVFGQLKQLQGEASTSYTQQSDSGTKKERTAFETSVQLAQVTAMTSGMLLVAFVQKKAEYREICRRFCRKGSKNEDVREFQAAMRKKGIPPQFLDVDLWDIDPEVPLGAGNPSMEITQANQLQQLRGQVGPAAQQRITHMSIAAASQQPSLADQLAPLDKLPLASDGAKWASAIFGTLMQGVPVPQNESVAALDQVETLLGLLAGVITRVEQQTNLATATEVAGLLTVAEYIGMLNQQIAGDEANAPRAKEFAQSLGKLMNIIKGFQTRLAQQEAVARDPEAQAKAQSTMMLAQTKMKISEAGAQQKLAHKQTAFATDQKQKSMAASLDQQRKSAESAAGMQRASVETGAGIHRDYAETAASVHLDRRETEAGIEHSRMIAEAAAENEPTEAA